MSNDQQAKPQAYVVKLGFVLGAIEELQGGKAEVSYKTTPEGAGYFEVILPGDLDLDKLAQTKIPLPSQDVHHSNGVEIYPHGDYLVPRAIIKQVLPDVKLSGEYSAALQTRAKEVLDAWRKDGFDGKTGFEEAKVEFVSDDMVRITNVGVPAYTSAVFTDEQLQSVTQDDKKFSKYQLIIPEQVLRESEIQPSSLRLSAHSKAPWVEKVEPVAGEAGRNT